MKKFQVIVADPPWQFSDSLRMSDVKRGAPDNYDTLTMSDIQALPVKKICHPDGAVLCLWVPSSLLQEGLDTMKAWGFTHKQTYVWVKTKKEPLDFFRQAIVKAIKRPEVVYDKFAYLRMGKSIADSVKNVGTDLYRTLAFGMGRLFRQTHEICLIGTSNNIIYQQLANKSQRSVCFGENLRHSSKPEGLQDSLEIMFPKTKKIELFARRIRPSWICVGNEVCNGEDIRVSLNKLINGGR
jgi:N6-adenosine-specific RNA methylase IME4